MQTVMPPDSPRDLHGSAAAIQHVLHRQRDLWRRVGMQVQLHMIASSIAASNAGCLTVLDLAGCILQQQQQQWQQLCPFSTADRKSVLFAHAAFRSIQR